MQSGEQFTLCTFARSFILILEMIAYLAGYKHDRSVSHQLLLVHVNDPAPTLSRSTNTNVKGATGNEVDTIIALELLTVRD